MALASASLCLSANGISRQVAEKHAARYFGGKTAVALATKGAGAEPAYYVFNAEREEKGFVIIAGSDLKGDVLAYSENGSFAAGDMPAAVADWLLGYEEQARLIREGRASVYQTQAIQAEVTPLISTRWSQDRPYNSLLPEFTYGGQHIRCSTGCVATAMAQILKYWSVAKPTTDIPSYTTQQLGVTMAALPATTFNYDLMEDTYSMQATGASADEVARLMLYCGQAAQMNYYQTSVAETSGEYLAKYFGFNSNYMDVRRDAYSCQAWDDLIYGELQAGRPVIYSGAKYTNSGHSFVVDGYRDGLYHVNWGWGGLYDGYYKLSEANPDGSDGIGAGAGSGGYTFRQIAVIGIQPEQSSPAATATLMTTERLTTGQTTYTRPSSASDYTVRVTFTVQNRTGGNLNCQTGLGVYRDGLLVKAFQYSTNDFDNNSGFMDHAQDVTFGAGETSGQYLVKAICRRSADEPWQENIGSDRYYIEFNFNGLTATSTPPVERSLSVNQVTFDGPLTATREATARVSVTNHGIYYNTIYLNVDGVRQTGSVAYIDQYATDDVLLHFTPATAGQHELAITDGEATLWSGTVTIAERRDPMLVMVGSATLDNLDGSQLRGTTARMTVRLRNNDTQAFDDEVVFRLFVVDSEVNGQYSGHLMDTKHIDTVIGAGETQAVEVTFDDLTVGNIYWIRPHVYRASDNTILQFSSSGVFTVIDDPSGVEAITVSALPGSDKVYDLQGRRVGHPVKKGVYVVNGRKVVVR